MQIGCAVAKLGVSTRDMRQEGVRRCDENDRGQYGGA